MPYLRLNIIVLFLKRVFKPLNRHFIYTVLRGGTMAEIIVVNVVASASIGKELMLQDIAFQLEGAEYDQDRFPGLIYKLAEPKTAVLIFRSGKVVCTGARSIPDVHVAINKVVDELRVLDMPVKDEPDIVIQNIVATTNLESTLNLIQIAMSLGFENVEYEPEAFPGLVYRMDDPKVVLLLFGSGKMVCVGAREVNNIKDAVRNIKEELSTAGLMRT
jgi:transcription initiation factor TFIID TATA-box-binding protein